ncbi:MAG: hypothetical protein OHK0046_49050 [Anaerolineae bacterium]
MRKALLIFVLLLLVALPLSAQDEEGLPEFIQHTECEVDLTGETITVNHFGDISGPYAFITQPLLVGLQDAADYYNERGGICGATIAQDNRDTGGDLQQTQAHYDFYSGEGVDLIVLYSSADAELLRTQVAEDEIPVIISAGSVEGLYGETGQEPGWIFATNPLYVNQFGAFCDYVAGNPETYPEPVIGYISWGITFGQAAYTPEAIAYCESVGVEIIDTPEYFSPIATDITTNVQNLVDAGANILYTNTLANGPTLVAKTVVDLGLEEDVAISGVNWVMDTSVGLIGRVDIGSDGLPAVNGYIGSLPFAWFNEVDNPGIALINEQADANERSLPQRNISYILGWSLVDYYTELYIQTVNRVGSLADVTGADLKETMESMVYTPLELYTIDFQNGVRALNNNRIAQLRFMNADGTGVAESGDDAMKIPQDDGTTIFVPVLVPLTEFAPAPDLRPGMEEG